MNAELPRKIGISTTGQPMHHTAGILLSCKGKYLLLDRVFPPPGYACPAGHIDEGEEPLHAAVRELREETGIVANPADMKFLGEEELPWNYCRELTDHYWYVYGLEVESEDIKIDLEESRSCVWASKEDLLALPLEQGWHYWFIKLGILPESV